MKLSIIICAYNEKSTLPTILKRIRHHPLPGWSREIIIIDNASTDGTRELIHSLKGKNIKKIFHSCNLGKSASLRSGIRIATGDYFIIQDADLEYHPRDHVKLIQVLNQTTPVVYGSRVLHQRPKYLYLHTYWGAKFLTWLTNCLYGAQLTDVATAMKLVKLDLIRHLHLITNGFGLDFELTTKLLAHHIHIAEVPITYRPRSYSHGKKINLLDGLYALWIIVSGKFKK